MNKKNTISAFYFLLLFLGAWAVFWPVGKYLDLAQSFAHYWAGLFLCFAVFWKIKKENTKALLGLTLGVAVLYFSFSRFPHAEVQANLTPQFTLTHANLFKFNPQKQEALTVIKSYAASSQVLAFQEVTAAWATALEDAFPKKNWPYRYSAPREDSYGLWVCSKVPMHIKPVEQERPALSGFWELNNKKIDFFYAHTASPIEKKQELARNAQLQKMAAWAEKKHEKAFLLFGDFNVVPWGKVASPLHEAGLQDTRTGLLGGTFPSLLAPIGLPIDYFLINSKLTHTHWKCDYLPGSDHSVLQVGLFLE
jgi:endonuclease/exonuclease/phosphatase (EEP) superfamily protein YafD